MCVLLVVLTIFLFMLFIKCLKSWKQVQVFSCVPFSNVPFKFMNKSDKNWRQKEQKIHTDTVDSVTKDMILIILIGLTSEFCFSQ